MPAGAASTSIAKSRLAALDLSTELGRPERRGGHLREQSEHLAIFSLELPAGTPNGQHSARRVLDPRVPARRAIRRQSTGRSCPARTRGNLIAELVPEEAENHLAAGGDTLEGCRKPGLERKHRVISVKDSSRTARE